MSKQRRETILRAALALCLSLVGWTAPSAEAWAAHAVPDSHWDRRPMRSGYGGCRVPYQMETDTDEVHDTVIAVINYINLTTPCIWEQRTFADPAWVAITENDFNLLWFTDLAASSQGLGKLGGRQELRICHGCNDFDLILHEMGHAMGLMHEHQRPDRDQFVNIYRGNVQDSAQGAFDIRYEGTTLGLPYDVRSVMHYTGMSFMSPWAYAACGFSCSTIEIKGYPQGVLSSTYFTDTDLEAMRRRYPVPTRLIAMHSGRCIDIPNADGSQGNPVQQFDCHEGANQGWLLRWSKKEGDTDYYVVESADLGANGMCLDVQWASQEPGAPVILWPCHGGDSQLFSFTKAGQLITGYLVRAKHSNQCLDVAWADENNGAAVVQSTCTSGGNQIWGQGNRPERLTREPPDPRCGNPRDPC